MYRACNACPYDVQLLYCAMECFFAANFLFSAGLEQSGEITFLSERHFFVSVKIVTNVCACRPPSGTHTCVIASGD